MFSGKTETLIRYVRRARDAELPVQVFSPALDTRNGVGKVRSHGGVDLETLKVNAWAVSAEDLPILSKRIRPDTRVVAIDEVQFFEPEVVEQVQQMLRRDLFVVVAGLDQDWQLQPFGPMPALLAMADEVIKLTSICARCKRDNARISHRRTMTTQQIVLGAAEAYEPLCRSCYNGLR
jgi:thymidine kinase